MCQSHRAGGPRPPQVVLALGREDLKYHDLGGRDGMRPGLLRGAFNGCDEEARPRRGSPATTHQTGGKPVAGRANHDLVVGAVTASTIVLDKAARRVASASQVLATYRGASDIRPPHWILRKGGGTCVNRVTALTQSPASLAVTSAASVIGALQVKPR